MSRDKVFKTVRPSLNEEGLVFHTSFPAALETFCGFKAIKPPQFPRADESCSLENLSPESSS